MINDPWIIRKEAPKQSIKNKILFATVLQKSKKCVRALPRKIQSVCMYKRQQFYLEIWHKNIITNKDEGYF